MKLPTTLLVLLIGLCAVAQQAPEPQLKLRILVNKEDYSLNENVTVKAELTNLTSKTLCFPVPDQDCETVATGFVVTTGTPVSPREIDEFLCHVDGGGAVGTDLDSQIKERWIKLPPKAVYVTNTAKAQVTLDEIGNWRLMASYHPPKAHSVRNTRLSCKKPHAMRVASYPCPPLKQNPKSLPFTIDNCC